MRTMARCACVVAVVAALVGGSATLAQPAPPAEYAELYQFLAGKIAAFDATLDARWDRQRYPVCFASELLSANGNRGRQLLAAQTLVGVRLELDRLRALGVKAATLDIHFPVLSPAFHVWNGQPGEERAFAAFFATVADEVRARGMKVVVESGTVFPGAYSAGSGLAVAAYYPTLSETQYVAGRAEVIAAIVRDVRPNILNIGSEPDTEARLTGQTLMRTPAGFAAMVRTIVDHLAASGLTGVPIEAGTAAWLPNANAYLDALCDIDGLWGIDLHTYPVNYDLLDRALALADRAHGRGKRVTILETWLQKESDAELGTIDPAFNTVLYARDAYSFWAPLDEAYLALMVKLAHAARLEYFSPFWDKFFFAYLDWDTIAAMVPPPTNDEIVTLASRAAGDAIVAGRFSTTGVAYARAIGSNHFVRRQLGRD